MTLTYTQTVRKVMNRATTAGAASLTTVSSDSAFLLRSLFSSVGILDRPLDEAVASVMTLRLVDHLRAICAPVPREIPARLSGNTLIGSAEEDNLSGALEPDRAQPVAPRGRQRDDRNDPTTMTAASVEIDRLLRECLRLRLDPTRRDAVYAAARGLADDWEAIGAAIESERVGPLLHQTVGTIVPPPLAEQFHLSYHATALRNLLLLRELGTCLRALTAAEVPVIVLKGAALIETVYGNLA